MWSGGSTKLASKCLFIYWLNDWLYLLGESVGERDCQVAGTVTLSSSQLTIWLADYLIDWLIDWLSAREAEAAGTEIWRRPR